ncbi:hypothetical protein [Brevundimonas sp.]|uniref:hypothetical protein n=1 Tax=Brevundimonas sp. TaxID=1871086 RepID=UPI002D699363|nr:hypothetical protein [Brevundimonas sp.]HYD29194.1 hypothetical protein [Brevundimonas sp.]
MSKPVPPAPTRAGRFALSATGAFAPAPRPAAAPPEPAAAAPAPADAPPVPADAAPAPTPRAK